ncbi:MAG TPA: hypothetical protein VHL54_05635 [Actinomycetota bacterium]|nr:hypothetical protein [Actinomycetota bacterium]
MLSVKRSRLLVLSLMVCGALFLAAPAIAQTLATFTTNASGTFSGTVTIPAGTAPGIYDLTATGLGPATSPYPPTSTGSLAVSANVVQAGQSITVSGSGFAANTPVVVSLSFVANAASNMTIAQTTNTVRTLTARIRVVAPGTGVGDAGGNITINNNASCTSDAKATASAGYTIAQTGTVINNNNSVECRSEATATGVVHKIETAKPVTKVLARTGVDALPLLAAALATILLGSVLLSAGRRRSRFEGSVRSA